MCPRSVAEGSLSVVVLPVSMPTQRRILTSTCFQCRSQSLASATACSLQTKYDLLFSFLIDVFILFFHLFCFHGCFLFSFPKMDGGSTGASSPGLLRKSLFLVFGRRCGRIVASRFWRLSASHVFLFVCVDVFGFVAYDALHITPDKRCCIFPRFSLFLILFFL